MAYVQLIKSQKVQSLQYNHYIKRVRIRGFSGLYFPVFGLNMEIYSVNLHIQPEYGKMWIKTTPSTDSFT